MVDETEETLGDELEDGGDGHHPDPSEPGLARLLEKVNAEHNFDLRLYKEASLIRRLRRRMTQVRAQSVDDYIGYLDRVPGEYTELLNFILINVTRFFRDPDAWAVIREKILPVLIEEAAASRALRFWSAGCSSGEEAYTIAMLVAEALRGQSRDLDVKIYGTDVDEDALTAARAGLYRLEQLKDVPSELLDRYFIPEGQMYRFRREYRKWCIFGRHDLIQDSPLSHVDLLACRNVLIYFDSELQQRILPRFQYAIRERGYLFLGKSESMLTRSRRFIPVDFKWRIFQRVTPPEGAAAMRFATDAVAPRGPRALRADGVPGRLQDVLEALPAAVLVIDPGDVVVAWNAAAEILFDIPTESAIGKKFRDLDISYRVEGLRSRIEEVKATHGRSRLTDVSFARRSGDAAHVAVTVAPLYDDRRRLTGILVSADDTTEFARLRDEISRISEESATANEELQSTNEELETTNEELQSTNEELETTNEELQSTNEELETTVEELQSINTELATMNTELERRGAELNDLDRYHRSIVDAIDTAVIVLDPECHVQTWNRGAARMWGLRAEHALHREFFALPIGQVTRMARDAVQLATKTRTPQHVTDVPFVVDGAERKAALVVTPLLPDGGDPRGILIVASERQET